MINRLFLMISITYIMVPDCLLLDIFFRHGIFDNYSIAGIVTVYIDFLDNRIISSKTIINIQINSSLLHQNFELLTFVHNIVNLYEGEKH